VIGFSLRPLMNKRDAAAQVFPGGLEMSEALFGALVSSIFVVALWFNYHGFIPTDDNAQQKNKTEQTDEASKDKSEQKTKSDKTENRAAKKAAKKKADICIEDCPDSRRLRSLAPWPPAPWPTDELRQ